MPSQWYCMILGQEVGPVGFPDMVDMVRAGTLKADDRVCRKGSNQWTAASEVIGLFRAAGLESAGPVSPGAEARAEPAPAPAEPAKAEQEASGKALRVGKRGLAWMGGGGILVVVGGLAVWGWWSARERRFPEPRLGKPRAAESDALVALRGPPPEVPSIPGLNEQVAELVPGLEDVVPAFSPALTPDLCTIVFAHRVDWRSTYDLYMATRKDVSEPFGEPGRIEGAASPQLDAYPTVAPDGLELIFARSNKLPRFFCCTRPTASSDFGEAVPWSVQGLEPTERQRLQRPQFIDPLCVTFAVVSGDGKERQCWTAERTAAGSAFGSLRPLPFGNLFGAYFVTEDRLRAYCGSPKGVHVATRPNANQPFGPMVLLLDAAVTGPIEGTIWVAPHEDVIVYCSPGPGEEPGSARRLCMIRF